MGKRAAQILAATPALRVHLAGVRFVPRGLAQLVGLAFHAALTCAAMSSNSVKAYGATFVSRCFTQ